MDCKNVLVVGGCGFLGSAIVEKLYLNNNLTVLDYSDYLVSPLSKKKIDINRITLIKADAGKSDTYDTLELEFDYIINAAAYLGIKSVTSNSIYTMCNNVDVTRCLLNFCTKQHHLVKYVEFSSSEIYGINTNDSDENAPAIIENANGARWCYAAAKNYSEHLTFAYSREKDVPTIIIRPFNIFGEHRSKDNVISQFAMAFLNNEPVIISGNGSQLRDWCYIDDFVDFFILMIESDYINEVLNVGNPDNRVSVLELANIMQRIFKSESEIYITNSKEPDVYIRKASIEKSKSLLGFQPQISLEDGLKKIYKYLVECEEERIC